MVFLLKKHLNCFAVIGISRTFASAFGSKTGLEAYKERVL